MNNDHTKVEHGFTNNTTIPASCHCKGVLTLQKSRLKFSLFARITLKSFIVADFLRQNIKAIIPLSCGVKIIIVGKSLRE
jgi:hypothetical protein